jgi:hypothetical protein
MKYDKTHDRLIISLGLVTSEGYDFEGGDFTITVDEGDEIVSITLKNASHFIATALAAGIEIQDAPKVQSSKPGMVWHDADSRRQLYV